MSDELQRLQAENDLLRDTLWEISSPTGPRLVDRKDATEYWAHVALVYRGNATEALAKTKDGYTPSDAYLAARVKEIQS